MEASTRPATFRIIIPFYKNPHLARRLGRSLIANRQELAAANARIVFINDSPDMRELSVELTRVQQDVPDLPIEIRTNESNIGFIRSVNRALQECVPARKDAILLNSDAYLMPHAITEMRAVAYADPLIGFVSPRSNDATICTLPHDANLMTLSPEEGYRRFADVRRALPRFSYVPTAVGFCLYVKWVVLAEFGLLDSVYGDGYNEENDLIMRANRSGYRAALANWAYVWHEGKVSFSSTNEGRDTREERNAAILARRYPEYPRLIREYFQSPEYRAEALLEGLSTTSTGTVTVAFDFSSFGTYHNGTFEAGKRLLQAASAAWPARIQISVLIGEPAWEFHALEQIAGVERVDPTSTDRVFAALVRVGQPFQAADIAALVRRSPVVSVFMLDPIAADCAQLRTEFDQGIWRFALQWSDVIFTNSEFTAEQFRRRYQTGHNTDVVPTLHSVNLDDYRQAGTATTRPPGVPAGYVLVMGNKFPHKGVVPTVRRLAAELPETCIVALGCTDFDLPNVVGVAAGDLSDTEVAAYYDFAGVVVYPTHYEGFGFPILHALARSKPVFARDLPVFREIVSRISSGAQNVHWFQTTADVATALKGGLPEWTGGPAVGEADGWSRSARDVLEALQTRLERVDARFLAERLWVLDAAFTKGRPPLLAGMNPPERAAQFAAWKCEDLLRRIWANQAFYWTARKIWQLYKMTRRAG
jgi:GT2 family glycosyltransferase